VRRAFDALGNLHFAEFLAHRVRKVNAITGIITTVAGTGVKGKYVSENTPATETKLYRPESLAFDKFGNLYIGADSRFRKVDAKTGLMSTFAGNGYMSFLNNNVLATEAPMDTTHITFDVSGDAFIADSYNSCIRIVTVSTGIMTIVAGGNGRGSSGDGGLATNAAFSFPRSVNFDASGNMFISDIDRIRKVDAITKIITTFAGKSSTYQLPRSVKRNFESNRCCFR
jgi:hypothetical protein